jgi:hypothetical protein
MDSKTRPYSVWFVVSLVFLGVTAPSARAQEYEAIGIRAQGMGGAFVALADDATASWWNPAGLATGAYFNGLIEYGRPDDSAGTKGVALAFPALGVSYYRLNISEMQPIGSTAANVGSRQDQGSAGVGLRQLEVTQYGMTVGQSVGGHLVIGSTLKLVRGGGNTTGDLDIGVMASGGILRAGLAVRNMSEPRLGPAETGLTLHREARAGVALIKRSQGTVGDATLDVDLDLTRNPTASGDARRVAGGGEVWLGKQIGFRGGISMSTIGDARSAPSAGLSVALRGNSYVDGQITGGPDKSRSGWGFDFRITF